MSISDSRRARVVLAHTSNRQAGRNVRAPMRARQASFRLLYIGSGSALSRHHTMVKGPECVRDLASQASPLFQTPDGSRIILPEQWGPNSRDRIVAL